ncbi:MAG: SAM-dependent methyltransferase [Deltaproteobacteria bacterium]|nr:SAM-dependent methyltransferase [Deltaproteobacteria bacterium]
MNDDFISSLLLPALQERAPLLETLHAEETTCYRLFHGTNEGCPGLTIDRYGDCLLIQTWREPIDTALVATIEAAVANETGLSLTPVWNHRAKRGKADHSVHPVELDTDPTGLELGLTYDVRPRHRGMDPLLFLDFRAGRRHIKDFAAGKSVLNLFSYTCGAGMAAAAGGATEVVNVDFAQSALEVGRSNYIANNLEDAFTAIHEDAIPIMLQYAGLGVRGRRQKRSFTPVEEKSFDLVILDPPRYAKSHFGIVDTVGDYQSLFKPALLSTHPGGHMLVTNNVASVSRSDFEKMLIRCAAKAERPISSLEYIDVEKDFPSPDGQWPLKMAWIHLES